MGGADPDAALQVPGSPSQPPTSTAASPSTPPTTFPSTPQDSPGAGTMHRQGLPPGRSLGLVAGCVLAAQHPAPGSMVRLRQDGTGPVTSSLDVGVSAPWLSWMGGLLVAAGLLVMVVAAVLVGVEVYRASR
jgi:hypothetical protein